MTMVRFWALNGPVSRLRVPRSFSLGGPTLRQCSQRRALYTLGIETSCDDTCVSVLKTGKHGQFQTTFADERVTCANKHHRGVHPVEAVVSHTRYLPGLVQRALSKIPVEGRKPDLIAVTRGPGMKPCLSVGISFAKALSLAWGVPLVGVHHMQAHALSIQQDAEQLMHSSPEQTTHVPEYPFLNLLVSGGHTMLVYTKSAIEHRVLASTQRGIANPSEKGSATAVGEMLDKCARDIVPRNFLAARAERDGTIVYAKEMENYCKDDPHYLEKMLGAYQAPQARKDEIQIYNSNKGSWYLTPPLRNSRDMIYDFTGLGGKVRAIRQQNPNMAPSERRELAYHTMRLAFEHIMSRVIQALQNDEELLANPPRSLVISGGVASNVFLRTVAASMLQARGFGHVDVRAPRPMHCTDNAVMIAWAGQKMYRDGWTTDLSFLPQSEWPIEEILTGVDCWVHKDVVILPEPKAKLTASQQDKTHLPENSESQEPPLPSTPHAPHELVEDAGAAHRREAKVKSVTQDETQVSQIKVKSDHNKASAKPGPGQMSSQDGQQTPDSEGPASSQEGTAPSPPKEAADRPAQQMETPRARAPDRETSTAADSVHSNPYGPLRALKAAEKQLLTHMVKRSRALEALGGESSNGPRERTTMRQTPFAKSHARAAQVAKRHAVEANSPAGAVQKKTAGGNGRGQTTAQTREQQVSRSVDEAGLVSSPDVDRTPKSWNRLSHTPLFDPVLRSEVARRRKAEQVPLAHVALKKPKKTREEKHEENKETGDQKTPDRNTEGKKPARRVVRLLHPAADEPAPKGSFGMGLDKLKRWIGL